jgi:hypothetical protein
LLACTISDLQLRVVVDDLTSKLNYVATKQQPLMIVFGVVVVVLVVLLLLLLLS